MGCDPDQPVTRAGRRCKNVTARKQVYRSDTVQEIKAQAKSKPSQKKRKRTTMRGAVPPHSRTSTGNLPSLAMAAKFDLTNSLSTRRHGATAGVMFVVVDVCGGCVWWWWWWGEHAAEGPHRKWPAREIVRLSLSVRPADLAGLGVILCCTAKCTTMSAACRPGAGWTAGFGEHGRG